MVAKIKKCFWQRHLPEKNREKCYYAGEVEKSGEYNVFCRFCQEERKITEMQELRTDFNEYFSKNI